MLIALLLGYLLLGGSSGDSPWFFAGESSHHMSKEVAKLEPDKEKRKEVDQTLKQIEEEYKKLDSERSELEKQTLEALANHDSTAEQFRALTQRADAINTSASKTLVDLRFTLRSQLSDAEWRQLFPPGRASTK